jgi:activator of HSP90 ATPase
VSTETVHVTDVIPATARAIYTAWIDGDQHTAMTGGGATSDPRVGGEFTAWDDYIVGRHLELAPGRRIVQSWRSTEFPGAAPDSRLIVCLDRAEGGTRVTIVHTDIPAGQGAQYESGWKDHYLKPMKRWFRARAKPARK